MDDRQRNLLVVAIGALVLAAVVFFVLKNVTGSGGVYNPPKTRPPHPGLSGHAPGMDGGVAAPSAGGPEL